jgi:hypothetical protein
MVAPDMEQICEIMLLSEGFDTAKASGRGLCGARSGAADKTRALTV